MEDWGWRELPPGMLLRAHKASCAKCAILGYRIAERIALRKPAQSLVQAKCEPGASQEIGRHPLVFLLCCSCAPLVLPRTPRGVFGGTAAVSGRILTPPSERRIYPAAPVPRARLPDESGVPVGVAIRLGGGANKRPRYHRARA